MTTDHLLYFLSGATAAFILSAALTGIVLLAAHIRHRLYLRSITPRTTTTILHRI